MKVAFTHNLRLTDVRESEKEAEYDSAETVTAIASAIEAAGHEVVKVEVSGPASNLLERLEAIANQMDGVAKSFAIQAGRELRIIVNSEKITDEQSIWLSKDVARKIESELQYPGQIKVTVIREMRATEFAK